jgi:uridine kinase
VIAINEASGAGKSTLAKALVQELGNAVPMYFDNYDPRIVPSSKYPSDISQWINNGANPNEWETPQLVEDLQVLRQGNNARPQKMIQWEQSSKEWQGLAETDNPLYTTKCFFLFLLKELIL